MRVRIAAEPPNLTLYGNTPATFANGDQLGARAWANGKVEIYKNGTLVATVTLSAADQAFFNAKGGGTCHGDYCSATERSPRDRCRRPSAVAALAELI